MKKKKDYLISCVIPCYNVALYIDEAIESVINQSIGFENIELILINDGSKDDTPKILEKYKNKYPDNIVYIDQVNSGVSASRNNGLKIATSKYLAFLDGDDKWDTDAFEKGITMLEKNKQIDFVSFRVYQFEGTDRYHNLDYKYDRNKIVDVLEDPTMVQSLVSSMVYRTDFVKQFSFDSSIKYSEDVKFVCELFFKNSKYGIISDSKYSQRKRLNETSTVQTCFSNPLWYIPTIKNVYEYLIDESIKRYKKLEDYIQLTILNEFQWRFFTNKESIVLKNKELKEYYKSLVDIVKKCDDKNILLTPGANDYKKRKILEIKHNGNVYDSFKVKDEGIYFKDTKVLNKDDLYVRLDSVKLTRRYIKLRFKFNMFVTKKLDLYINNKKYTCKKVSDNSNLMYDEKEFFVDMLDIKELFLLKKTYSIYTIIDGVKCKMDIKLPNVKYEGFKVYNKNSDLLVKTGLKRRLFMK